MGKGKGKRENEKQMFLRETKGTGGKIKSKSGHLVSFYLGEGITRFDCISLRSVREGKKERESMSEREGNGGERGKVLLSLSTRQCSPERVNKRHKRRGKG